MRPRYLRRSDWTPIPNAVFEDNELALDSSSSAAIYLFLYDRCYHSPTGFVALTANNIAKELRLDRRTVAKSLLELKACGLIRAKKTGIKRSRFSKPVWEVPHVNRFSTSGSWTPIPRFVFRAYLPAYPKAALLTYFIYLQNIKRLEFSWPGVSALKKQFNFSPTTARDSLRNMFDKERWSDIAPRLIRPLQEITGKENQARRFKVRFIKFVGSGQKSNQKYMIQVATPYSKSAGTLIQ